MPSTGRSRTNLRFSLSIGCNNTCARLDSRVVSRSSFHLATVELCARHNLLDLFVLRQLLRLVLRLLGHVPLKSCTHRTDK
jgi:hypothetical protein